MDSEVLIGIVSVCLAVALSAVVWFGLAHAITPRFHRDITLMTFAGFMMVASLVPQLVKNYHLGAKMHESVSPFFVALYPLIILTKFPAELDLLREATQAGSRLTVVVVVLSHYFMLLCFIAWVFQYANSDAEEAVKWSLFVAGTLYTLATVWASQIIYVVVTTASKGDYTEVKKPFEQNDSDDDEGPQDTASFM